MNLNERIEKRKRTMALNDNILHAMDTIDDANTELRRVAEAMRNISAIIIDYNNEKVVEMCSTVMDSFADTIDANRDRMIQAHAELRQIREALS